MLTWMGIDTVIMMGVVTNGCVELTARVAADLGYQVILVGDACAAHTSFLHDNALKRMDDGYIHVTDVEAVAKAMLAATARAARAPVSGCDEVAKQGSPRPGPRVIRRPA